MKILRRHRGFTTNSSAASEWIDPDAPPASIPLDQFDAQGNRISPTPAPTPDGDGGPATISLEGWTPTPTPGDDTADVEEEGPATISLEGWTPTPRPAATATTQKPAEPKKPLALENTVMVLGFLGTVLGVFALERLLRRWWRKRKDSGDDL